uniref:DUF7356 domain-containing protein n=1 Tax=Davidia involucrata TaxID=16924 RepID=A0A5B7BIK2_DAVIN
MYRKLILMVVLLILLVPQESNASLIQMFRKLVERDDPNEKTIRVSPSPSPVPSANDFGHMNSEDDHTYTNERCEMVSNKCQDNKNMTACIPHAGSGSQGSFLLIQNDGEISLKVNFTILPVNITYGEIDLLEHRAKKINISANVEGSQSIVLHAGNGDCEIHMRSSAPENFYKQFPYATYVTPINGAYLLFLTALIIGGTWACCKLGKRGRNLDGVPYQELEMGQQESLSGMNVETAEGWDQGWDDDWDEEKAVKSPSGNHVGNGQANGFTSRSSKSDGWGNDWDD